MVLSYFILSRLIFDSAIWRYSPDILKLFIYLIGTARHSSKPKKYPNLTIKRGELVTSLEQIAADNEYMEGGRLKRWSRQKVSRMLKTLALGLYIECLSDTYGTHIRVIKYNTYQDPSTYKADTYGTDVEQVRDDTGTVVGINNNVNNGKHGNNGKNGSRRNIHFAPPTPTDVVKYMSDNTVKNHVITQSAEVEAEKFMNHYTSNGWLIGGKSPMKDWKASVRNWLINVKPAKHLIEVYKNPGEDQYKDL